MKIDLKFISVGVVKDILRSLTGLFLYGIDISTTGTFFAAISPALIVFTWSENVDGESNIDSNPNTNQKTYYFPLFGLIVCVFYIIFFPIYIPYVLFYFISRVGYFYYNTYLIENNLHLKLTKQKLIEIILIILIIAFRSIFSIELLLILFLSTQSISSLFYLDRLNYYVDVLNLKNYKSKFNVLLSARSISILLKNLVSNMDSIFLVSLGNPEGAGTLKYIRSIGNGINLILNQVVDRYRNSLLKKWILEKKSVYLILTIFFFFIYGLVFGVILLLFIFDYLDYIFKFPNLPFISVLYFGLYSISPIMRVSYLYSNKIRYNITTHFLNITAMMVLILFKTNSFLYYLIIPQTIGFFTFLYWVYFLKNETNKKPT